MGSSVLPAPAGVTPPQQPTDPGDELRRLARQYATPTPAANTSNANASGTTPDDPGDALRALVTRYAQPSLKAVGDIDLREPASVPTPAPPPRIAPRDILNLKPEEPTADALSVRIPEQRQLNGLPQLAHRNNNPGNLKFEGQAGAELGDSGFAKFPTPEHGYRALLNQIGLDAKRGHTVTSFATKYAPPNENDTAAYIAHLSTSLGATPETPLSQLDPDSLARAIVRQESSADVTSGPPAKPVGISVAAVPPGPRTVADVTRVGAEPSAGYKPSTLERIATFPLAMGIGAAQHPVDFMSAPFKAALTANRAAAEQGAENAVASSGGPIGAVERTVSPRDAAIASAQAAATLFAPSGGAAGEVAGSIVGRALPAVARAAPIAGRIAGQLGGMGAAGAAFDPEDPVVGFFGTMLLGVPHSELPGVVQRAAEAGQTRIAGLVDAARQADEAARVQGRVDAHDAFKAMVAKVVPTLRPNELAYLDRDPVLGPLSRDALSKTSAPTASTMSTAPADVTRQLDTPQSEPDQTLTEARGADQQSLSNARTAGLMDARAGAKRNPYIVTSPLHAEYERGFTSLPVDDVGAYNVLPQPPTAEGLKQLAHDRTNATIERATDPTIGNAPTNSPAWLRQNMQRYIETANRLGIADDVEALSAQRLTAKEVRDRLADRMVGLDPTDRLNVIRSVRSARGIPSMDEGSAFDQWLAKRSSGSKPGLSTEPTPVNGTSVPLTPPTPKLARGPGDELRRLAEQHAPQSAAPPAYDFRDVIRKSANDLERIAAEETVRDKNLEREMFGEDGAKRYGAAQRTANSQNASLTPERESAANQTIQEMESALTEAQRNRLFGIGQTGLNAEELRDAARAARGYSPENLSDAPEGDLYSTVGRELTTGAPDKDAASALRLRGAAQELQRRTGDPLEAVIKTALEERVRRGFTSPGDAVELVRARLQDLQRAGLFTDEPVQPATSKPAALGAGDQLRQLAEQYAPREQVAEDVAHVAGRPTRVLLRDGQILPAEYRVVSADDLQSSHDPFTFNPNPRYPEGVQGRDYQRNKAAQQVVARRALEYDPNIALNPSESISEGAPTILPNGTVLAGNERSMLPRRAMQQAPDRYAAYVEQLKARASEFGLDPASIDGVNKPVLVRALTDSKDVSGGPERWAAINRLSDEVSTKAKSATEEGAARAAKLTAATESLAHLSETLRPEQTVSEYLGTPDGRAFVRKLQGEGVITPEEFSRLTDASGSLTDDGRSAIRRMLLSTAVTDSAALLDAPASTLNKIEHAVPSIISTKGTDFDVSAVTTDALKMLAEARDHGVTVRDLAGQGSLWGDARRPPAVVALARFLDESKPSVVKGAFRRYATLAREALDNAESTDMFGGTGYNTPRDAFTDVFGGAEGTEGSDQSEHGKLFAEVPMAQRPPGAAPTRAGQILAEARGPRTNAGPALGGQQPAPTVDMAVRGVNRFTDALRKIFSPASRGPEALATALTVREHDAALVHRFEQAKTALMDFARMVDRLPVATQLDFIDRLEHGRSQATPELTKLSQTIRGLLDSARDEIRALGDGQLEHWIENYFPHIWADPERAKGVIASIMGKRSLTGPGSFLKHRVIPTVAEGIDAGLTPVTYNPIDLTLLKLREMHRYLAGQRILTELKASEQLRFVNSFSKAPNGYQMIDDKLSTVYGPPTVTVVEAFDHMVRQGLENVMSELGVQHTRRPNIGGGSSGGVRLGFAQGDRNITTRSATPESVIEHELGHALDAKLGLWNRLHDYAGDPKSKEAVAYRKAITVELRNLADLRHEGIDNVEPAQHQYVRSRPEKVANAVMGLIYAPERMRQVAPTVFSRLREILREDPTTAKILDIKPSFRHGADTFDMKTPGQVVLGHWFAPEPVARVMNNYLSPGLSQAAPGPWFDVYRGAGNILNAAELGMSAYHLGFTSLDAIVSKNALGLLQLREGHPLSAAASIASSPAAPITTAIKGFRLKRAYLRGTTDPVLGQIIDGLEAAGGRAKMDEFYGGGAWRNAKLALHEGRYREGIAKLAPAAIEQSTAWLMQHVVPWQKLGVFHDLAQHELAKLPPGADRMQVREVMARAWDSVENRMGQLTYNNLFWHRYLKDGLMASVRSVGWNLGTFREIGGGALDVARTNIGGPQLLVSPRPEPLGQHLTVTPRMSYIVALPATAALLGGVYHYLHTGVTPSALKDWFYPRTGHKNDDGSDERVQLPSYMRDIFDYSHAPGRTLVDKLHPLGGTIASMLENKNFYGNQIRNPDDPAVRQLAQEAQFIAGQFVPFGVRNATMQHQQGQPLSTSAQNLVGITPAPRSIVRSAAEQRMAEMLARRSGGTATPEEVDQRAGLRDVKRGLRQGLAGDSTAAADALRALAEKYGSGEISKRQAQQTLKAATVSPSVERFKRLTANEAIEVYQLATPAERTAWADAFRMKLQAAAHAGRAVRVPAGLIP